LYEGVHNDYAGDLDLLDYLESSKSMLHTHYIQHYSSCANSLSQSTGNPVQSPSKVNFTSRYKKKGTLFWDDLEKYFKLLHEDFDLCKPLEWWVGQQAQFLNLYCLARDVFSIPGMSIL